MDQPIAIVSRADVERIVARDFPPEQQAEVLAALDLYGVEHEPERARVQLAVLKLAGTDIAAVRRHVEVAKQDYRDVLAYAEYPKYMVEVSPTAMVSAAERKRIVRADWEQYEAWLRRE